jgi:RNA polymerase sigma factor (sigma-70 family)
LSETKENIQQLADHLFRHQAGKMVAVLTRIFGLHNLELAEDVVQEAFGKALTDWRFQVPLNPEGWLMQTAKNKAIDVVRRQRYQNEFSKENSALLKSEYTAAPVIENLFMEHEIEDSQLRMIFACCHPVLSETDQIALILKTCSGFGVHEIASALISNDEAVKKRLQRARAFIVKNEIELRIPTGAELNTRLDTVLHTIYLIFNEGYNSSNKEELIRKDLCEEAIHLALLLTENNYTNQPKTFALVSLLSLLASRFDARLDEAGDIVVLKDQDRTKWDHELIKIGLAYFEKSMAGEQLSEYHLEAAIVAEHSTAETFAKTNWQRIHYLYNLLAEVNPSPMVLLNRAIVIGKTEGPEKAIDAINNIPEAAKLITTHYLFPAILGDLYMQCNKNQKARELLERAITLTHSSVEKNLLKSKLKKLEN